MSQEFYDPREDLSHSIKIGQVYTDARHEETDHEEYFTIVYVDDERVLLRSNEEHGRRPGFHHHRGEWRDDFEELCGVGRYKLKPDMEPPVEVGGQAKLLQLADQFEEQGGRKNKHYAEAFRQAVEVLKGERAPDDSTPVKFEGLAYIGEKTASRLRNAGYVTRGDCRRASDEDLLEVSGLGKSGLESIRDAV